MRPCPSCGERGIRVGSVYVSYDDAMKATPESPPPTYAQCARCDAVFRHPSADVLEAAEQGALGERFLWIVPPWKERSSRSDFEMSWDIAEAFFEDMQAQVGGLQPMVTLIAQLRAAGYDTKLRAGQSMTSLGLSRSKEHGLRDEQAHLFLMAGSDGTIAVQGTIGGERVAIESVPPELGGELREVIERLCGVPID